MVSPVPGADWLEFAKAIGTGIGLSLPVIGTMGFFHQKRSERFDRLEKSVDRFEGDLTGLIRQLGTVVSDVRVEFLPRREHESAIHRLEETMSQLSRTIEDKVGTLNDRLFEIARERRNDPHR